MTTQPTTDANNFATGATEPDAGPARCDGHQDRNVPNTRAKPGSQPQKCWHCQICTSGRRHWFRPPQIFGLAIHEVLDAQAELGGRKYPSMSKPSLYKTSQTPQGVARPNRPDRP